MSEQTNEELLDVLVNAQHRLTTATWVHDGSPGSCERCDGASEGVEAAHAAVLARMSPGWQPIATAPKERRDDKPTAEVLLRGFYPDGRTMSDIYHSWWAIDHWARWPFAFPPTHFMHIQPLPTPATEAEKP